MLDVRIPPERVQDPFEKNVPGIGVGRDPCRTPMQWDDDRQRGLQRRRALAARGGQFYREINVQSESADSGIDAEPVSKSVTAQEGASGTVHRRLSAARDDRRPAGLHPEERESERFLVALNMGAEPHSLSLAVLGLAGRTILSTQMDREDQHPTTEFALRSHEGIIVQLV